MRPPRSRFTRIQRVSCCMALLYLSMLVNAMWYQRVPPKPKSAAFEIGPFALSPEQIGVGFFSNLIVFPPTFLIVLLFRKSRLRKLRPSRIKEALKKQAVDATENNKSAGKRSNQMSSTSSLAPLEAPKECFGMGGGGGGGSSSKIKKISKKKGKKLLPWWCRYIGWFLCILSMVVSIFFLWAYGIQFGDEKTRKWVTSLIVSFFTSILITQPVKVLLTAMILSTILKSPDSEVDDSEEDEEEPDLELAPDEEWLHTLTNFTPNKKRNRAKMYRPPDLTALERAKLERLEEIKMTIVLKDIWSYLVFLWILIVLSYGNRDPNAFIMKANLQKLFIEGANTQVAYTDVKTTDDLWNWILNGLNKEIRIEAWYNGRQAYGLRGFVNDKVSRMMGYGVLRQVRIKESTCQVNPEAEKLLPGEASKCRSYSNMVYEDRKNYVPGWGMVSSNASMSEEDEEGSESGQIESEILKKLPGDESIILVNPSKSKKTEWEYRRTSELDGLPFWGKLDVYSGGGYVLPLKGSEKDLKKKVEKLKKLNWIDERTRAVFAEFSIYNPQVNLFGVITVVSEFLPGGGVVPNYRIDVVRLIHHHQGFGLFVILCELSFVAFILYFTVREIQNWRKAGISYLKSYWNWAELILICFAYIAVGLYFYRFFLTHRILKIFDKTHGNAYIKLQYVAQIDEIFGYIVAFSIFIGILKFIRLLRFNKRMGILYSTLNQCSKDLKSFCIVFLIVFFAFVQMFNLLFGLHLQDFSSLVNAAETTFGMVTGKFDFDAMCRASPFLGPLSFFIFILVAQMVLVNVFLTLIISAFETVKHDISRQSNEFEIVAFMVRKTKELLGIYEGNQDKLSKVIPRQEAVSTIEEQLNCFPQKVDQLLEYINSVCITGGKEYGKPDSLRGAARTGLGRRRTSLLSNYQKSHDDFGRGIEDHGSKSSALARDTSARPNRNRRRASRGRQSIDSSSSLNARRITGVPKTSVFDWIELGDDDKTI